ncbi:MAG: glycosyltransferase [Clostridia bacterium]|nr:glycosyltransferase [Clostridia bacterium]
MSKLSIIVPVYNVAPFLNRCIDSILAQTLSDWELILVDDGSKDISGDICDDYADKDTRIKVIHKENGGAGSARNAGLQTATGDYVAFPDSDDWIDPDAYEFCIKKMEEQKLDLLLFGSINTIYDKSGNVISEQNGNIKDVIYDSQTLCRENWINLVMALPMDGPSNKMYRMSVIKENNLSFPNIRRMQDGVFNMNYFGNINSFAAVPHYFYHFTMHSSKYQRKKIPAAFLDCAITYHKTALDMLTDWGLCDKESERKLGNWFSETVIQAELNYLPGEKNTFFERYRHIKNINDNEYVVGFFARYKKIARLCKKEFAVSRKYNLILTAYTYII